MEISWRVRALLTLLWIIQGESQRVEIPRREMEVVKGQMVVLQAWYSPNSDISKNTVLWNFMASELKQVISYTPNVINHGNAEFRKRVGFSVAMPSANISVFINNTQESDSGRYLCQVLIPSGTNGGLVGDLRLNVKVPPSPPVCTMTGSPVLNGNVTLSCKSSSGKPVPQYKWTKAAPVSEVFFSPIQKWTSCPQPLLVLGFMDERQGTLRLSNLTKAMSGKYVCRASNTAGSDSCSINLEVFTSSNAGVIAAAALGSIVGLIAILLVLVFILRRRGDTEEEIANEIKEDAPAPKRVSLAKSGTGSDIISKNGTLSSIATSPRPREYPYPPTPASDTGSVLTQYQLRPGEPNPLQGLPGYHGTPPTKQPRPPSANGVPPQAPCSPGVLSPSRTKGAQPQVPHPLTNTAGVSSATLTRMGAVRVMVPTHSQAGSLV